ncbi:hypothetical protein V1264_004218 [Littorina saxatilis]|uniref:Methyltransferase type 11 domain-containing protein n=1 Tax=Littorina saxatilis TaxID=31220 RepID=A0AAN9B234_9CAEN
MAETVQVPNYAYGLGLLAFPLGLFVYSKVFPSHAKKINRKFTAWMCSKMMPRVHAKCIPQKKALFQSFDLLYDSKPLEVLEIGVGPGSNLDFLPAGCNLSCLEPNLENQPYVEQALKDCPDVHFSRFVKGFAEDMREFDDNTFDAVILTFTLCSVRHLQKALSEIKRVLKSVSFEILNHLDKHILM